MVKQRWCLNNKAVASSLSGVIRPGLLTESNTAQVGYEYVWQVELRAGPSEHSITYGAGGYNGIGTAGNSILEVLLLDINGKLPVSIDKGGGAADSIQSLVFSAGPLHADKLEDLIQESVIFMHPSGGAVSLVGYLLAQCGYFTFVVP